MKAINIYSRSHYIFYLQRRATWDLCELINFFIKNQSYCYLQLKKIGNSTKKKAKIKLLPEFPNTINFIWNFFGC